MCYQKKLRLVALCTVVLFSSLLFLPQLGVVQRVQEAESNVTQYLNGSDLNTSVGIRFQLWYSAWHSFLSKPLFGWGQNGVELSRQQQERAGLITPFISNYDTHAHNEYLDEMSKRGIIGLLMLLSIFFVPLYMFKKVIDRNEQYSKSGCVAMAGCFLIINSMDFCLTQAFYQHIVGVMYYFPSLGILLGYCLFDGKKSRNADKRSLPT